MTCWCAVVVAGNVSTCGCGVLWLKLIGGYWAVLSGELGGWVYG